MPQARREHISQMNIEPIYYYWFGVPGHMVANRRRTKKQPKYHTRDNEFGGAQHYRNTEITRYVPWE